MSGWSPPRINLRSSGVGPLVLDGLSHGDWYSVDGMMRFEVGEGGSAPGETRETDAWLCGREDCKKFGKDGGLWLLLRGEKC